ncbi:MAG TPA: ABC transporter ATP-binding protein [Burkholderiales bacterium]|nr:ABC transporter ATP-binding protein [Burkholderiales bacterium]
MLSVDHLGVRFDGVRALDGVGFALGAGEALGLIGPNGSGKTTLFDAICGLVAPDSGRVLFDGREITREPAHAIARRGIARTFQGVRLFERMTALDNVRCAQPETGSAARSGEAERLLERVGIGHLRHALAEDLPLAARRRLELARVLARRPRVLLLDEPAGAMTPAETAQMVDLLRSVHAGGCAMIVVEHRIEMVAEICARVLALDCGRVVAEGSLDAVLADARVRSAYLGVAG